MGALVWAETPDDESSEAAETQAHGRVDETFAARRLRRWLQGMFGGDPAVEKPPADEHEG